jgi:hypothetical protein
MTLKVGSADTFPYKIIAIGNLVLVENTIGGGRHTRSSVHVREKSQTLQPI